MSIVYVDSSALVRLATDEPGAEAVAALISEDSEIVTSAVSLVEVRRALARVAPGYDPDDILDQCIVIALDASVIARAGLLAPASLRSLDAIHVASALMIADDLDAFVTCDQRQASAAVAAGLPVSVP
jgi:predicted nucleic acid-binding protein